MSIARANDELPNNMNTVEVSRGLLFCYGVGALVAPPLIGFAMSLSAEYGFYALFGLFSLSLFICAFRTKSIPKAERAEMQYATPIATASPLEEIEIVEDALIPFDEEAVQEYQAQLEILEQDPQTENENIELDEEAAENSKV